MGGKALLKAAPPSPDPSSDPDSSEPRAPKARMKRIGTPPPKGKSQPPPQPESAKLGAVPKPTPPVLVIKAAPGPAPPAADPDAPEPPPPVKAPPKAGPKPAMPPAPKSPMPKRPVPITPVPQAGSKPKPPVLEPEAAKTPPPKPSAPKPAPPVLQLDLEAGEGATVSDRPPWVPSDFVGDHTKAVPPRWFGSEAGSSVEGGPAERLEGDDSLVRATSLEPSAAAVGTQEEGPGAQEEET